MVAELALNPTYLRVFGDREACQTMVHEQAHVARHYLGPRNRNGKPAQADYHDRHWGDIMRGVGLMPSNTGKPGGKQTGPQMMEYLIPGGPFEQACTALFEAGFRINWGDNVAPLFGADAAGSADAAGLSDGTQPARKDRLRFSCPGCGQNAWAKPAAQLACGICHLRLAPNPSAR